MNNSKLISKQLTITPYDNERLALLSGYGNKNILAIEKTYNINIHQHGNSFCITGLKPNIDSASNLLHELYQSTNCYKTFEKTVLKIKSTNIQNKKTPFHQHEITASINVKNKKITPFSPNQNNYIKNIRTHSITFGIGPAGTGKTYLAVALALESLDQGDVDKLIFVRPAVEAGEKIGFLPGAMEEKIFPYLRPIYDALYDLAGFTQTELLLKKHIIEIVPLAFMRGRTLRNAYIILDEAQNTTPTQMKMFLTRMGMGSKIVITGDLTQIDLPPNKISGLNHAMSKLDSVTQINFNFFDSHDTIRHPLVKSILDAYDNQNT